MEKVLSLKKELKKRLNASKDLLSFESMILDSSTSSIYNEGDGIDESLAKAKENVENIEFIFWCLENKESIKETMKTNVPT